MSKRIGVMGCGGVAGYGHLPSIARAPGLSLHAMYDPQAARMEKLKGEFEVSYAGGDLEAFFDSGLDAVVIASPAPVHEQNVLACAQRGLPVLCEKPLSMDHAQGLRMIEAMASAEAALYVAFCYRFSLAALRIRELVVQGAIGQLRSMRLIYNWDCHGKFDQRDPSRGESAFRAGRMNEGGPMVDCGTHQIDLAQWWADSAVVSHEGFGAWADEYEAPDHMWAHMDHADGTHTAVEISYGYGHTARESESSFKYELIGTEGLILYDRNSSRFELRNGEGTFAQTYHQEKGFDALHAAFAQALETGEAGDLPTAQEGLRVTEIATQLTQQAMSRRPVQES